MNEYAVDLGMTDKPIQITPRGVHYDVHTDDYGPDIPAELLFNLAEVRIQMTLVHYDVDILNICIQEAFAGGNGTFVTDGTLAPAGKLMGGGVSVGASGNHYVSLNIISATGQPPWHFPATYLDSQPLLIPIGTERSLVQLSWRGIPYGAMNSSGEVLSTNKILWDRSPDAPP